MADKGVSCLPVMKDNLLVGIITESDLFRVFVDMFGTRHQGVRITFSLDEKPGQLARVAKELAELGGNIVSLVTFDGDDMSKKRCTCKVCSLSMDKVKEVFEKLEVQIEDIR
jgi:acetoin utilization protein AcuB